MIRRLILPLAFLLALLGIRPVGANHDIVVSPIVPSDIPGGADNASLKDAARFAWKQFIALNWPALAGTRDTPNENEKFGDRDFDGPLVWHTFRHKVEIYPGQDSPPGFVDDVSQHFGYNHVPPKYVYNATQLGQPSGEISACPGQNPVANPSFINLDEVSQIGLASMFAGSAPHFVSTNQNPKLIRFLAKANKVHYTYVVNPDELEADGEPLYIGTGLDPTTAGKSQSVDCSLLNTPTTFCKAQANFLEVSKGNGTPTTLTHPFISFPSGTIHIKSAWRELNFWEKISGRFYTTTVRYYEEHPQQDGQRCYREADWGLVGLHIEHKTPTAPAFIFFTFEQADNLKTFRGRNVENQDGRLRIRRFKRVSSDTFPPLVYQDGNPPTLDIVGNRYCNVPGKRLYYLEEEVQNPGLPGGGFICQKFRTHPIPPAIIDVNKAAHRSIKRYNRRNGIRKSVWEHYKLINIQYQPFDFTEMSSNIRSDRNESTYYLNNEVIETDYTLSFLSGQTVPQGPPTNMPANFNNFPSAGNGRQTFQNVLLFNDNNELIETFNMGGCMGCHGNAQSKRGTDFSFILSKSRVPVPETPDIDLPGTTNPLPRSDE